MEHLSSIEEETLASCRHFSIDNLLKTTTGVTIHQYNLYMENEEKKMQELGKSSYSFEITPIYLTRINTRHWVEISAIARNFQNSVEQHKHPTSFKYSNKSQFGSEICVALCRIFSIVSFIVD